MVFGPACKKLGCCHSYPHTHKKKIEKLKINNSSLIQQRIEVTGQTYALKIGRQTDRYREIQFTGVETQDIFMGTTTGVGKPKL